MSSHLQIKEYHRPPDLARAVEILSRHGNKARVIAGGTDILPLRPGVKQVDTIDHLVDISNLDLNYINDDDDYIRIGAATPIASESETPKSAAQSRTSGKSSRGTPNSCKRSSSQSWV